MTHHRQLALPLPSRPAQGREDFYVTTANALAVAQVEGWQIWPERKLLLIGPYGAGKSHLSQVWARLTGAAVLMAADLSDADIPALAEGHVCVEGLENIAGDDAAEAALFHLHNLVLAQGHALLMTARKPAAQWGVVLADLQSRMMGTQAVQIDQPDDGLLGALLVKLFSDRQIVPAPEVIPYLTRHMPRSYLAAQQIVDLLDKSALGRPKGVSRHLAVEIISQLEADDPLDE